MAGNQIFLLTLTVLAVVIPSAFAQNSKRNDQINPCDVKGKVASDITYCDRYWECVNGQPELYDCPNGLAFAGRNRGVADGCDYPWRGNYCEGKQLANPPIATEHCDWLYGIFGHETSCTRYWTCWNGTATEQLCIGGLLYNEDTHACDWPENVPGCQKHPLCKDDPNGNVPLGKSCNRYWNCQGGYPRLQRCPAMLVFDKRSLRCVVPPTEDCDVPSTTPPPPEDIEEDQQRPQQQQQRPSQSRQQAQAVARPQQQQQQQQRQQQSQQQQPQRPQGDFGGARPIFTQNLEGQGPGRQQ